MIFFIIFLIVFSNCYFNGSHVYYIGESGGSADDTGTIIGGAVGGICGVVAIVLVVIATVVYCCCRKDGKTST